MAVEFTDNFNRADEQLDVSADWTAIGGTFDIISNAVELTALPAFVPCSVIAEQSTDDYYVQSYVNTGTFGSNYQGIIARQANASSSDSDGYYQFIQQDGSNNNRVFKRISNSWTSLAAVTVSLSDNTGYTIKIVVDGSATDKVVCTIDGADDVTTTDTSITARGRGGIQAGTGNSTSNDFTWDDFEVGTLLAAAEPLSSYTATKITLVIGRTR